MRNAKALSQCVKMFQLCHKNKIRVTNPIPNDLPKITPNQGTPPDILNYEQGLWNIIGTLI